MTRRPASPDVAGSLRDLYESPARGTPQGASRDARRAAFHRSMPGYSESPLVNAPLTAEALGLDRLLVKLESERFGLPSFKILGASWAVCRALSALAGRDEPTAGFDELRELAGRLGPLTFVAATDGNHGRAVARMAKLLSLGARILVPEGTAPARIAAIQGEGATVDVIPGSYDDAIAASAALAGEGHLVISDTSWPGYEEVPHWVIDGYGTIFDELAGQTNAVPELCVVQIGVGALASATVGALAASGRVIAGVEPADAACVLAALRDGEGASAPGPHRSLMVGLNCGVASPIALPDLRAGLDAVCAIDDSAAIAAVRLLVSDGIEAGETGAAGVAGLVALHERFGTGAWERLGLGERPAALTICTEGPTDPDSFARITAG
ncbi:MAG TPA: diaminopropionate ammonia-lyase [Thermoleophilaceae bacterium]